MNTKITVQEAMRRAVYPDWMREAAARGGKKSRRKLTKKQARDMVKARELKRAVGVDLKPREGDGARSTTNRITDNA